MQKKQFRRGGSSANQNCLGRPPRYHTQLATSPNATKLKNQTATTKSHIKTSSSQYQITFRSSSSQTSISSKNASTPNSSKQPSQKTTTPKNAKLTAEELRSPYRERHYPQDSLVEINWYPGHMKKARDEIEKKLEFANVVLEVRDARIPLSSRNQHLETLLQAKPRVVVMNKSDLADPYLCKKFESYFKKEMKQAEKPLTFLWTSMATEGKKWGKKLIKTALELNHGLPTNALIVGMPNTGKSTIINTIKGAVQGDKKSSAKTGALPGVTRIISGFRISDNPVSYLIDTPGIMVPKVKMEPEQGLRLALTGAIRDAVVGEDTLTDYLFHTLSLDVRATHTFCQFYGVPRNLFETEEVPSGVILELVAKKMGARLSASQWDIPRVSKHLIARFRKGDFGKQTLDRPPSATQASTAPVVQVKQNASERSDFDPDNLSPEEMMQQRMEALEKYKKTPLYEEDDEESERSNFLFQDVTPTGFYIDN